eukprot:2190174-Prymnesium_polylepis.1
MADPNPFVRFMGFELNGVVGDPSGHDAHGGGDGWRAPPPWEGVLGCVSTDDEGDTEDEVCRTVSTPHDLRATAQPRPQGHQPCFGFPLTQAKSAHNIDTRGLLAWRSAASTCCSRRRTCRCRSCAPPPRRHSHTAAT